MGEGVFHDIFFTEFGKYYPINLNKSILFAEDSEFSLIHSHLIDLRLNCH